MPVDTARKSLSSILEQGCHPGPRSGISIGLAALFGEILTRAKRRTEGKQVQDDTRGGLSRDAKHIALALCLIGCLAPAALAQDLFLTNAHIVDPAAQEVRQEEVLRQCRLF